MNLTISGHQRTKPSYLTSLFKPFILFGDKTPFESLSRIATYSLTETSGSYHLKIDEFRRSLQLNYPFSLSLFYPNVFGSGEICKINVGSMQSWGLTLEKPFGRFLIKALMGTKWGLEVLDGKWGMQLGYQSRQLADKVYTPNEKFPFMEIKESSNLTRFIENGAIYDRVGLLFGSVFGSNMKLQGGITASKKPYLTFSASKMLGCSYKCLFTNLKVTENIFISHKKKTFTGLKAEAGVGKIESTQVYLFYASGLDSKQLNLLDTWKSFFYAQAIMPKVKSYDACVGIGVKVPLRGQKLNVMYRWGCVWEKTTGFGIKFEI